MNTKLFKYAFSIVSLLSLGANAMQNSQLAVVNPNAAFIPERHGPCVITHDGSDFSLYTQGRNVPIQRAFVDKPLRGMDTDKLAKVLAADTYLKVKEVGDNEFGIELKERLRGGGVVGAWIGSTLGYGGVWLAGETLIWATTAWCPPLQGAVIKMTAVPLHNAACAAGVAAGIALGSATGPV